MGTILGLLGVLAWIVGVIGLAAGITWSVVKVFPGEQPGSASESSPTG